MTKLMTKTNESLLPVALLISADGNYKAEVIKDNAEGRYYYTLSTRDYCCPNPECDYERWTTCADIMLYSDDWQVELSNVIKEYNMSIQHSLFAES